MADNTLTSWAPFLFDLKGKVWEVFPSEAPFLAEVSGYDAVAQKPDHQSTVRRISKEMDSGRDIFSGKQVRHTLILAGLQGGGFTKEGGTWNAPIQLGSVEIHINLVRALVPFSVTVDVERDSFDNSNAVAVATLVQQARTALARLENLAYLGDGTGKVSGIIAGGSPGLTITVSNTGNAPMDVLLPGTIWDVNTITTGAFTTGGHRRKITTVVDTSTTQSVTFDTNIAAADGDSGAITFSALEALYIPGSWSNGTVGTDSAPGNLCAQGLEQAAAAAGTFEFQDKAVVAQWQGTDGRGGDASVVALNDQMLDGAVRRGRRAGLGTWTFGIGDPAAIDLYKQGKYAQLHYDPQVMTLKGGFSGIVYDGADKPFPMIKDPMLKKQSVRLIDIGSFQLYGDQPGPSFLEDDGAMFRRFLRALPKEAELLDRTQLGVVKCNTIVRLDNLAVAA